MCMTMDVSCCFIPVKCPCYLICLSCPKVEVGFDISRCFAPKYI